ncbi:MAG: sugar ABC transporter substrate-binding protein [Lachnospiraceae bacterium]
MKKRMLSIALSGLLAMSVLSGCGTTDNNQNAADSGQTTADASGNATQGTADGTVNVAVSLGNAADYYIGTMVGAAVEAAFKDTGANVQVLDGADDVVNQINQIQNSITSGVDIIYIFPVGDGETYYDVLQTARASGVKTLMSNNYAGEGGADAFVGSDEFQMGVMMAAMVSEWADSTYPDAGAGEVEVLIVESTFNSNTIKRCLGMRMVGEKFLREADVAAVYFVKTAGEVVSYLDEQGNEVTVDEPTGGLILDDNGYARLNPYYNEKIRLIEYSNRNSAGTDSTEAQNAIENAVTMGERNLKAVMSYGDVGAAIDTKLRELIEDGRITTDIDKAAVFCSDLTDTNKSLILKNTNNESILRGVMASGDLINTLQERAKAMVAGEAVPEFTMEPISYIMSNDGGTDVVNVYYTECAQLPETNKFFK